MKTIFGTYRPERLSSPYNLGNGISLNGEYHPAMFLNNQFADWNSAGLTNIIDLEIQEDKYTGEITPGVKKLTRFIRAEYNENYVQADELSRSMSNVGARFNIDMFDTSSEAAKWIRDNTSLEEVEEGKFLISEESELMGEVIPANYLIIE